jgi:cytochrome c biogenesis factor
MNEINQENQDQGKKVLEGVTILFWVVAILAGLGMLSLNFSGLIARGMHLGPYQVGFPTFNNSFIFLALYVLELVGLYMRKKWAVPLGRAGLVVTMVIFFPVGTIFGAILWKRINDPLAKKYLNYPTPGETKEETEVK